MKALSIKQPWAWLIANGFKDIENRNWPYEPKFRGRFLIHASKSIDLEMHKLLCQHAVGIQAVSTTEFAMPREQLRQLADKYPMNGPHERGGIVGVAEIIDVVRSSASKWFTGPIGLVIKNANPLPFMSCRGMLGFFDVDYNWERHNAES